jgi:hypothetical protein
MRQPWYTLFAIVLLAVFLSAGLAVAGNGKISGTVKGPDGSAVAGANVVLEGTTLGGSADVNGNFNVLNIPPGTYRVRAASVGFTAQVMAGVRVGSDQTITLKFQLQTEAVGLAEVVIQAERPVVDKSQTGARTRLSSEDFTALPGADLQSLVATSASTYKGYVRGGRVFETKTLIDGIDVTDQYGLWFADVPGGNTPYATYNGVMRNKDANNSSLIDLSKSSVEEANVLTGGVGYDYSSASAGIISYNLKEGRGNWTFRADARMGATGYKNLGPDAFADDSIYFRIKNQYANSAAQADRDKAARFTYYKDKYSYNSKFPDLLVDLATGGSVSEDFGLYLTGRWFDSHGLLPNEHTRKLNASVKANYSFTPSMKLNATFLLEDRGKLFGWKNTSYSEDFRYFLEGVPTWMGANIVGSLKWTHVLSPKTYYEVQASMVNDNSQHGYSDDNNDGKVGLSESGDYLTWADTAQVNRYMANAGNAQMDKFFSPTPRNETASENTIIMSGATNLKIARPGIYYENFTNNVITVKGDYTSQINANHQLRAGLQARFHDLDMTRRAGYIGGVFPTYKNYVEEMWNVKPKEYSAYAQDKMEYAGLIINLGLRLDGLGLAAGDYANFFAPFMDSKDAAGGSIRIPVRGENAAIKWFFSPRLGVSHPISDNAAMYFSFSRQQQSQPFSKLYTNYNDFGNPSLPVEVRTDQDPIRSTNYDLGIQWAFLEGYGLDINAYYKDIQSYGGTSLVITPNAPWRLYQINTEMGYADSRGIELTFRKTTIPVADWLTIGGRLSYAYSYVKQSVYAGGNVTGYSTVGGDSAKYSGQLPWEDIKYWNTIERNVLGGNSTLLGGYDRPHRISYNLILRFPWEFTLSSVGTFQTGFFFPLTLGDPRKRELGQSPSTKQVDFRIEKAFTIKGIGRLSAYVDVINAFGWENIIAYNSTNVGQLAWERTGDPTGGPTINRPIGIGPSGNDGSMIYDIPREVFFGLSFSF